MRELTNADLAMIKKALDHLYDNIPPHEEAERHALATSIQAEISQRLGNAGAVNLKAADYVAHTPAVR